MEIARALPPHPRGDGLLGVVVRGNGDAAVVPLVSQVGQSLLELGARRLNSPEVKGGVRGVLLEVTVCHGYVLH